MHIEDIIIALAWSDVTTNPWDGRLIHSYADQVGQGIGFTEKQGAAALKIISRHESKLNTILNKDISNYIKSPSYRIPFRVISTHKKISVVTSVDGDKWIKAEFPYNETMVDSIRNNRSRVGNAVWNAEQKAWLFSLNESSICFLMELTNDAQFELDTDFQNYADQVDHILQNMEQYVPTLVAEDNKFRIKNASNYVPLVDTDDILAAVFSARKYGITTWDDTIAQRITSGAIAPHTRDFLLSDPVDNTHINCETNSITCLTDIVQYMWPCLFVIPGGNELVKLEMVTEFLKSMNISTSAMSVMFRLPSESGKEFNAYVKDGNLNNPISDTTQAVFISGKLPKPVLQSKIQFNAVVNLGFGGVHYSIREYAGKHHNLIYFSEKTSQKEFNFGNL